MKGITTTGMVATAISLSENSELIARPLPPPAKLRLTPTRSKVILLTKEEEMTSIIEVQAKDKVGDNRHYERQEQNMWNISSESSKEVGDIVVEASMLLLEEHLSFVREDE